MTNNIKLYIEADYDAMSRKAASVFAEAVTAKPTAAYGFATGSTPVGMYNVLVEMQNDGKVDLSRLTAFNLDEYHPIAGDNPQSYRFFMDQQLFARVGLPKANRYIPCGEAADPLAECAAYEQQIADAGGIEMQILGIGANGHIGFNEPGDVFSGQTGYVPLAQATIDSNVRFFDKPEDMPRHALTMGVQDIMMAKRIILLASSAGKAAILAAALTGPITPQVPASVLQLHQNVIVIADQAAASKL